jgi:hypothetical protein
MVDRKKIGIGGSVLAVLAVGGIGLAYLGGGGDVAVNAVSPVVAINAQAASFQRIPIPKPPIVRVPHPPALPRSLPAVVESGLVKDAIEQGISTFRSLRRGDSFDKVAVDAGCAVMASGIERSDSYESIEKRTYEELPIEFRKNQQYNWVVAKPMGKVVAALTVFSESQGGSAYYYAKYCLLN